MSFARIKIVTQKNSNTNCRIKNKKNNNSFYRYSLMFMFCFMFLSFSTNLFKVSINYDMSEIKMEQNRINSVINYEKEYNIKKEKIDNIIANYNKNFNSSILDSISNTIIDMDYKYSNIDIDLICGLITHESAKTWNPKIKSPVGAIGLMQIMPTTGLYLAYINGYKVNEIKELLEDPIINIKLGCFYLDTLIGKYGINGGLVGYNAGDRWANVFKKTGRIVPDETKKYVPSIFELINNFKEI